MIKWVLATLMLALVVSCGSPTPPPPQDLRYGAPVPRAPRTVVPIASTPCRLLDDATWTRSGFNPVGEQRTTASGDRSCWWTTPSDDSFVSVIIFPTRDVLVDAYRLRKFAILRPAQIADLPATEEQASLGSISCTITVGTAVEQGFIATYDDQAAASSNRPAQACAGGRAIAEQIVATLPPLTP